MKMFATVYRDTSLNFPYPDSIEYMGINSFDNIQGLKEALDDFRTTMGLDNAVKIIIGKSERIVRGFFADESDEDDSDDQYYVIDVEYVEDWQIPMMNKLLPFDNEDVDINNFNPADYVKNHIDSIHIDNGKEISETEPSKDTVYMLVKNAYRKSNDEVLHQALIKKISANRSDLEYEIYNDLERIKKINPKSEEFRNESDTKVGVRVYGLRNGKTELTIIYRIIKATEDEMIISQSISDPTEIFAAGNYDTKTPIKIFTKPFKTSININEIAQGVRDLLGGDINDSDVKAILDCFGFEIDGQFIPLTAKPDGTEQTGMSPNEFKSKYSDILK